MRENQLEIQGERHKARLRPILKQQEAQKTRWAKTLQNCTEKYRANSADQVDTGSDKPLVASPCPCRRDPKTRWPADDMEEDEQKRSDTAPSRQPEPGSAHDGAKIEHQPSKVQGAAFATMTSNRKRNHAESTKFSGVPGPNQALWPRLWRE